MSALSEITTFLLQGLALLGRNYSPEQYLAMTKVQCLLWTGADVVIVVHLLKIANLARAQLGKRKHLFSYFVLGATLLFVPLVPVAQTGAAIFRLELIITVPHFLLILYVLAVNARLFPEFFAILTQNSGHKNA